MTLEEIRQNFADARRAALEAQGEVAYEKVKENQKTMKDFYLKLEEEMVDLPPEAAKIIDAYF